ncbi:MAG: Calx-beta domain-containing protein [Actinomycetota bacterium]
MKDSRVRYGIFATVITGLAVLLLAPAAISKVAPPAPLKPAATVTQIGSAAANTALRLPVLAQIVSPTVTVTATDPNAAEAGSNTGTFTVSRTTTTGALTVNLTLTGTAVNGTDYTLLATSVVIADTQASATVTVTPTNDSLPEDDETVILTVVAGTGYTIGSPANATVTIDDNDPPVVSVAASDSAASETGPDTGMFTVSRTGSTTFALTVHYTLGGSAGNGTDYAGLGTSVVIAAGQPSASIVVTPINDVIAEAAETVVLNLAANPSYAVGSPSSATVNIADNDLPVVTVNASDDSASESGPSTGTFTFSRTGDLSGALTVNYSIGGSATNGSDYAALLGTVVIPASASTATVVVTPVDDALVEGQETVILTVAAGTGYSIGSPNSDDVKIADNDGPTPVPGTMPTTKDQCKKGGWQTFGVFKNQGDCVSWIATGGKNPPAG